jgi:hypothetical protein
MMIRHLLAATLLLPIITAPALAGDWVPVQANDVGGIIAWSPAIAHDYRDIAAAECARFDKVAVISSVHRRYGDYVGFRCHFAHRYDPRKAALVAPFAVRALY